MKSLIVAAVATFALGASALAAQPAGHDWLSGAAKTTPVATETCATAKVKYDNASKTYTTSKNLAKAEARAKAAAAACAKGESVDGVGDYDAAVKLLES